MLQALNELAKREPQWAEANILKFAHKQFIKIQAAWGAQDLSFLKAALHPILYPGWEVDINTQKSGGVKNVMAGRMVLGHCWRSLRLTDGGDLSLRPSFMKVGIREIRIN